MCKMKKVWEKIKCFIKEIGNVLTDILCPICSIVAAAMEVGQLPASWIKAVKKVEYWLFYACGTKDVIDQIVGTIDIAVQNKTEE